MCCFAVDISAFPDLLLRLLTLEDSPEGRIMSSASSNTPGDEGLDDLVGDLAVLIPDFRLRPE